MIKKSFNFFDTLIDYNVFSNDSEELTQGLNILNKHFKINKYHVLEQNWFYIK